MMALEVQGEMVGAIGYAPGAGECWITAVVVDPRRRGLGLGSEGVQALEEEMARQGTHRFWARVPLNLGLALFFWLRLGYRPGAIGGDGIVMVRQVGG